MIYLGIEEIVAGALYYGFDEIKPHTLPLLIKGFLEENQDCTFIGVKDTNQLNRISHISLNGNLYSIINNKQLREKFSDNKDAKQHLKIIAGFKIIDYFDKLDLADFLLGKIEQLGYIYSSKKESELFSSFEMLELRKLLNKGYLMKVKPKDIISNNSEITITELGQARLFMFHHQQEIEAFRKKLDAKRYVSSYLEEFLSTQDLSVDPINILTCERFVQFCKNHKKEVFLPGTSPIYFRRIKNLSKNNSISKLFTIYDQGHSIILCHPDNIFNGSSIISTETQEIDSVSWDDVNEKKLPRNIKEYKTVETALNSTKYFLNKQMAKSTIPIAHLAVLEKYCYRGEDNYLVRGIVKKKEHNFYAVFNPEYEKSIPTSHIEKSVRKNGQYTPGIYLVKRLNRK